MKARSSLLAVLAVLAHSRPSVAADQELQTRDQENAARAACLMGDYQKGAEILVKLFIQTRDPTYLYNQGRCYQQNHRWEEALDRFREYLRKAPKLAASAKAEVQQHIAECEANQSKAAVIPPSPPEPKSASAGTGPTAVQPAPVAPTAAPVPPPEPASSATHDQSVIRADLIQTSPEPSQAQPESSILTRWWFWTAVGVVVAGGVTAGLLLSRGGGTTVKPFYCPECESTTGVNAP